MTTDLTTDLAKLHLRTHAPHQHTPHYTGAPTPPTSPTASSHTTPLTTNPHSLLGGMGVFFFTLREALSLDILSLRKRLRGLVRSPDGSRYRSC